MSDVLSRILTAPTGASGRIILAYSACGLGKTSTYCQAPNGILIQAKDNSAEALKESGAIRQDFPVVSATGWEDSLEILKWLAEGDHSYKSAILDGASGLSEWAESYTVNNDCDGSLEKFTAYGRGDRLASVHWLELLDLLDSIRNRGIWLFLLAHSATVTVRNPAGFDYLKTMPHLSKDRMAATLKYADAVLYHDYVTAVTSVDKISGKGKAVGGGEVRVLYTQPSASMEAKNRLGLASPIMLGNSPTEAFKAFYDAVKAGKARKAQ